MRENKLFDLTIYINNLLILILFFNIPISNLSFYAYGIEMMREWRVYHYISRSEL